jgi:hypothetical protein
VYVYKKEGGGGGVAWTGGEKARGNKVQHCGTTKANDTNLND